MAVACGGRAPRGSWWCDLFTDALWGTINQRSIMCMTSFYHSMGAWLIVGAFGRRPGPARELVGRLTTQLDALWGAINQHSVMCMTSLYKSMGAHG